MGISPWQLLIVLAIVLLLFGTKKLKNLGSDLGGAVKGFKSAVKDGQDEVDDAAKQEKIAQEEKGGTVIEGKVASKERDSA